MLPKGQHELVACSELTALGGKNIFTGSQKEGSEFIFSAFEGHIWSLKAPMIYGLHVWFTNIYKNLKIHIFPSELSN